MMTTLKVRKIFEFDHAIKYQEKAEQKSGTVGFPSAFILDSELDSEDARVIRQEATTLS